MRASLVVSALALEGCWGCDQSLCFSSVKVNFTDSGLSEPGTWTFTAEVEGEVATCVVTVWPEGQIGERCEGM